MKKRIYIALGVVWVLAFAFLILLLVNNKENNKLITNYYAQNYKLNKYDGLGFTQPYIAPFNRGDVYYKKGEYELARAEYQKALTKTPPKEIECKIRVNLALTELEFIDLKDIDYDEIDGIIESLRAIQKILTLKGCANEDLESGHDETAQQLYNDIENFIEQLEKEKEEIENEQNQQNQQGQGQDNQSQGGNGGQDGQNGGQDQNNGGQDQNNGGQDDQNGGQDQNNGGQDDQNGGQDQNNGGQDDQNGGQDQNNGGQDGQGNVNDLNNHDDQGGQGDNQQNQNGQGNGQQNQQNQNGQGGSQDPVEQYFNDIMNQGTGERLDDLGDAATWYNYSYTDIYW